MSILTCAQVHELAPELALGVLGGAERAEAIAHVNDCARCQAYVGGLTDAADAIPQLAPEIEPPAGFEARVLESIRADGRRHRRRWVAAIAGVAAAVAIVSITAVRVIESGESSPVGGAGAQATAAPVAVSMRDSAAGLPAGWAYVSNGRSVAITVSYGVDSGNYRVQVSPSHGAAETLGTMTVTSNQGSWTGHSVQLISAGSTIALVDAAGNAVCHGTVPA